MIETKVSFTIKDYQDGGFTITSKVKNITNSQLLTLISYLMYVLASNIGWYKMIKQIIKQLWNSRMEVSK